MDLRLNFDDYLNQGYEFWKNYRKNLTEVLNSSDEKLEKTKDNIVSMANRIGIKPTARYFDISPSTIRNYLKEFNDN